MFKIVGLIICLLEKNICGALVTPVSYNNWDSQAKAIVSDIIVNPEAYKNKEQRDFKLSILHPYLAKLQGGAYRIYCEFLENWQTGDSVDDYVPDELSLLATQIYRELLDN